MDKHTAFITGAGRNIGRAIALDFARRGINVVLVARKNPEACEALAQECRALGVEALVQTGDAGNRNDCERMAREALGAFGTIDILVTAAAMRPSRSLLDTSDEQWDEVMNLNLNSAFWLSRAFLPGMVERRWGRVIGFTGMHAIRGAHKGPVAASKHGQWGLMKAISHEFAASGVTANAISPGPIGPEDTSDPNRPKFPPLIPMARRGTPEEVAAVAGLLVSREGAYISGQMIPVNGGGTT